MMKPAASVFGEEADVRQRVKQPKQVGIGLQPLQQSSFEIGIAHGPPQVVHSQDVWLVKLYTKKVDLCKEFASIFEYRYH